MTGCTVSKAQLGSFSATDDGWSRTAEKTTSYATTSEGRIGSSRQNGAGRHVLSSSKDNYVHAHTLTHTPSRLCIICRRLFLVLEIVALLGEDICSVWLINLLYLAKC